MRLNHEPCSAPMHLLLGAVYRSQGRRGYFDVSNVTFVIFSPYLTFCIWCSCHTKTSMTHNCMIIFFYFTEEILKGSWLGGKRELKFPHILPITSHIKLIHLMARVFLSPGNLVSCMHYSDVTWASTHQPGRCSCNLELVIFKLISRIDILSIPCEIVLKCHNTSLMISHWFR